jgi:hypothetical protein
MIRKSSLVFWGSASKVWSLDEIGQSGNWKSISFNHRGIV